MYINIFIKSYLTYVVIFSTGYTQHSINSFLVLFISFLITLTLNPTITLGVSWVFAFQALLKNPIKANPFLKSSLFILFMLISLLDDVMRIKQFFAILISKISLVFLSSYETIYSSSPSSFQHNLSSSMVWSSSSSCLENILILHLNSFWPAFFLTTACKQLWTLEIYSLKQSGCSGQGWGKIVLNQQKG